MKTIRVDVTLEHGHARFRAASSLDARTFRLFQDATVGTRFVRAAGMRVATFEQVDDILRALRDAGASEGVAFDTVMDPALVAARGARHANRWVDAQGVEDRIERINAELKATTGNQLFPYQKTGATWLALRDRGLLADEMGLGKAGPVSEPVLTPDGWRVMGDLRVGDRVMGSRGTPITVMGVFPQGVQRQFRIELADGRWTRATADHLWRAQLSSPPATPARLVTVDTSTLRERLEDYWLPWLPENGREPVWSPLQSIRPDGNEAAVCIRVDAPDCLYVSRHRILTHNTLQAIVAFPAGAPILVVCPVKVKGEWLGEMRKWRPQMAVNVLRGRDSFRWPTPGEMLILNYDILPDIHDRKTCNGFLPALPCTGCATRTIQQHSGPVTMKVKGQHLPDCTGKIENRAFCLGCHPFLRTAPRGLVLVFDEAQYVKNEKATRSRAAKALANAGVSAQGRAWELTGTPMENDPQELWNVLDVVGLAEQAFDNERTFYDLFNATKKHPVFGGVAFGTPKEEVAERLQRVSLRRVRAEVQPDLPGKLYKDVRVEIDGKAMKACERFAAEHGGVDRIAELLMLDKFPFDVMSAVRQALAVAKIPALLEHVQTYEEANEPVIVFSAHRAPLEALAKRPGWGTILGGDDEDKVTETKKRFQAGELRGIAISIAAGGTGITLTRAAFQVWVDRAWNPQANYQGEARSVRIGQRRTTNIADLISNHPLDTRVTEILLEKKRLFEATINAASVAGNAQPNAEILAQLATIEAELASDAVRTSATPARAAILMELQRRVFEVGHDELLATRLVEEAEALGLTEGQWTLADVLVGRGVPPETFAAVKATEESETATKKPSKARLKKNAQTTGEPASVVVPREQFAPPVAAMNGAPIMSSDTKDPRPPRSARVLAEPRERENSPEARKARRESQRVRMEADTLIEDLAEVLTAAPQPDRQYILDKMADVEEELAEIMCLACGDEPHENEEDCPEYEDGDGDEEEEDSEPPRGPVSVIDAQETDGDNE